MKSINDRRRYEDAAAGLSEEFVQLNLGLGNTIGVLSRPLGNSLPVGWVICHSFGIEQIHLARLDVIVARTLAASGFPVFRFHGQGYGDSEGGIEIVGLTSHLAEAEDAVDFMGRQEGVEEVGILGARFGGTVAALIADRLDLPLLGLWEPIVSGSRYMNDLLRSQLLATMAKGGEGGVSPVQQIRDDLSSRGWSDIRGLRLSAKAHQEIGSVDLGKDLERFSGSALLMSVSRSGQAGPPLLGLRQHLENLGAACTFESIGHQFAGLFGQSRWLTVEGGRTKRDVLLELNETMAGLTARWAVSAMESGRRLADSGPRQ